MNKFKRNLLQRFWIFIFLPAFILGCGVLAPSGEVQERGDLHDDGISALKSNVGLGELNDAEVLSPEICDNCCITDLPENVMPEGTTAEEARLYRSCVRHAGYSVSNPELFAFEGDWVSNYSTNYGLATCTDTDCKNDCEELGGTFFLGETEVPKMKWISSELQCECQFSGQGADRSNPANCQEGCPGELVTDIDTGQCYCPGGDVSYSDNGYDCPNTSCEGEGNYWNNNAGELKCEICDGVNYTWNDSTDTCEDDHAGWDCDYIPGNDIPDCWDCDHDPNNDIPDCWPSPPDFGGGPHDPLSWDTDLREGPWQGSSVTCIQLCWYSDGTLICDLFC